MLLQYQEIGCNELPNIVFQTVVYRLINKKLTFETFGKIPSFDEWVEFKNFFQEEMRLSKRDSKREKPFTAAHQVRIQYLGHKLYLKSNADDEHWVSNC